MNPHNITGSTGCLRLACSIRFRKHQTAYLRRRMVCAHDNCKGYDLNEIRAGKLRKSWHVEPCIAFSCELLRRGHEVRTAVAPDMIEFVESAGLAASAYGPDLQAMLDARKFHTFFFRNFWSLRELARLSREAWEPRLQC